MRDVAHGCDGVQVENALDKVALFARLTDEAREALSQYFRKVRLDRDELIFSEGDPADAFYVVLSGQVQIVKGGSREESRLMAILSPGDFFGEMGLVEDQPRLAAAAMLTRGVLLRMGKVDFERMMEAHPLIGMSIRTEIMRRHGKNIRGTLEG